MTEYGFWVYTGVGCGGCEGYREEQWEQLLDDMADGGMNSIVICLNWLRLGFRSRLPYLQHDQYHNNPVIASDNEVLRFAIDGAKQRGIKVWLQLSLNLYYLEGFDLPLPPGVSASNGYAHKFDLDAPQIKERSLERAVEIIELFPQCDGVSIEFEEHNKMYAHKIAPYNAWAKEHGMPSHEELMKRPANARGYQNTWVRHYTTWQVCQILQQFEKEAASRNWKGDMNAMCATGSGGGVYLLEADLERFAREAPNWSLVTYDYERW